MKMPEQIATEIADEYNVGIPLDVATLRMVAQRAIEADRAQRPGGEVLDKLRHYAEDRARHAKHPTLNTVGSERIASDLFQILGLPYPGATDEQEYRQ